MHLLPRILSQFPHMENPVRSAPWRGMLFLLHRCRTCPAFSTLPERTAAVVLFSQSFQLIQGKLKFFLPDTFSCFFCDFFQNVFFTHSLFVSLIFQHSFGNFKKPDRLMFPFISLLIGIADFSPAAIIFKSRYLI